MNEKYINSSKLAEEANTERKAAIDRFLSLKRNKIE